MEPFSLTTAYQLARPGYEKLCAELTTQLNELVREKEVTLAIPIHGRVKGLDSLVRKAGRFEQPLSDLADISDIAGLRVVLLFERDVHVVLRTIESQFQIIEKENTRDRLGVGEFGYGSHHFILEAPESWLQVPTLKALGGLRCEIQVRTAAQHIWAAASHLLQYKRESDVPVPVRRSINRVAALLETVDLEFERLIQERGKYVLTSKNSPDQSLNADTLQIVLSEFWPPANNEPHDAFELSGLLQELDYLKISTVNQLKDILSKEYENVLNEEKERVASELVSEFPSERVNQGVFYTHSGLTRNALRMAFGAKYDEVSAKFHPQ